MQNRWEFPGNFLFSDGHELEVPLSRVLYILRTRSHLIKPIGRAGCLRLYDRTAVETVRDALHEMDQRQCQQRLQTGTNPRSEDPRPEAASTKRFLGP